MFITEVKKYFSKFQVALHLKVKTIYQEYNTEIYYFTKTYNYQLADTAK